MSTLLEPDQSGKADVRPLLIGPRNAEAAIGAPWRWVRDTAAALGVPLVGHGRKQFVRADLFLAALAKATPESEPAEQADPAEEVRRRVGLVRVA